jgi:carbamoyl-phosphate synthase large subunit
MKSTGEVMGIAPDYPSALRKALLASGISVPAREEIKGRGLLATIADFDKEDGLELLRGFSKLGFQIYATSGTAAFFANNGLPANAVKKLSEGRPHIIDEINNGKFQLVINTVSENQKAEAEARLIRRAAVEHNIPVLTSLETANALLTAIEQASVESTVVTELGRLSGGQGRAQSTQS